MPTTAAGRFATAETLIPGAVVRYRRYADRLDRQGTVTEGTVTAVRSGPRGTSASIGGYPHSVAADHLVVLASSLSEPLAPWELALLAGRPLTPAELAVLDREGAS
jgi:hypothetical protein